jgi:aminoglycoside 3-N-acetyltransferase I
MPYSYQHVGPSDLGLFKQLLAVFGDAFNEQATYQQEVPKDDYLRSLLGKEHVISLVALDGEAVAGGLVAYQLDKFERVRSEIYIYDLAVAESHRRKGVARQLIRLLQRIAKERGAWVIYVQADRGDDAAIRLYESLGVREDVHHFDIPVG